MKYRNAENWKTEMKKISASRGLNIQDVQQRYVLEEFAEKIGSSNYKHLLILKGGFVVSTILGLDTRMTRDLDVTCRSTIYQLKEVENIFNEIINTKTDCFFTYSLDSIKKAQENDVYSGYIVQIIAVRDTTQIKIKIDISNNTLIFPEAFNSKLNSLFSNKTISLMTYSVENIIAEKYETTLDRGEYNTRIRDLFDIYLLMSESPNLIDQELLAKTIIKVSEDRDTLENLNEFDGIIEMLGSSTIFNKNFLRYKEKQYPHLSITLIDILNQFKVINQMTKDFALHH